MKDVIETLLNVKDGDNLEVETTEGYELSLYVVDVHRREVEYYDGIPHKGVLKVSAEVDQKEVDYEEDDDALNLPSPSVTIRAEEPKPGNWYNEEVEVWDPVVDEDNVIIRDEYKDLGEPTKVEVVA